MMRIALLPVVCVLLLCGNAVASSSLGVKKVTLDTITHLTVDIVPDHGTRFSFPFVLDEQDKHVPFTLQITNDKFRAKREPGRDFFVIDLPPPPEGGAMPAYRGNMFVSVGGYNITVLLRATTDTRKHVSDYVFRLSDKAREATIAEMVERRIAAIKEEYDAKTRMLDQLASKIALNNIGKLALAGPSGRNIKEEQKYNLSDGGSATLFLDKVDNYGGFSLYRYELTNHGTNDLIVQEAYIIHVQDEREARIETAHNGPEVVQPGRTERFVITTDQQHILRQGRARFVVRTNLGEFALLW